jgi:Tfp pilus assembly protein PilN
MIEINLLPEDRRKKESRMPKIDISRLAMLGLPILKISSLVIAGFIAAQLTLFAFGIYSKMRHESSRKELDRLSSQKKEADAIKKQVNVINTKMTAIDELMVKRFSWARKLDSLNDTITSGIWLNSLSFEEKAVDRAAIKAVKGERPGIAEKSQARYLVLTGYASRKGEEGTALVGRFIRGLKTNTAFFADFSEIELVTIKSEKIEDQEVMSFKITCLFRDSEGATQPGKG